MLFRSELTDAKIVIDQIYDFDVDSGDLGDRYRYEMRAPFFRPDERAALIEAAAAVRIEGLDEDDPAYTWKTLDIDRDQARLRTMTEILSPLNPDLRPYQRRRGKLIMYHGWSDPGISAAGTVAYYDKMRAIAGGQAAADEFARLFMVPGMHHCGGGPGPNAFDMLPALEAWVERGVAPQQVTASHLTDGKVDRTRPLCPHPHVATYKGSGSVDDAESYVCK